MWTLPPPLTLITPMSDELGFLFAAKRSLRDISIAFLKITYLLPHSKTAIENYMVGGPRVNTHSG